MRYLLAVFEPVGLLLLAIAFGGSLAVHEFFNVSLGLSFLIFFVGWPVVGMLITMDDDLKGGWSNPDGSVPPRWLQARFWGQIICGLALSSVGAAVDVGWRAEASAWYWVFAALGFAVGIPMIKRRQKIA
jgi:hypothetical protein